MEAPEAREDFARAVTERRTSVREIVKPLLLVAVLAGSLAAVRFSPIWHYLDRAHFSVLRDQLTAFHSLAPFVFLAAGAVVVAMGVPRTVISVLGGMAFGFLFGTVLATAAAFAGSVAVIWLTRVLGHPLFHQRVGHRLKALEGHLMENGFVLVLILRQLPLPSMLINVLIGLSTIKMSAYLLGSAIGLLPEAAIFALFGSSVREDFTFRISIASLCLIALVIFMKVYFRKSPLARELSQKLTRDKT